MKNQVFFLVAIAALLHIAPLFGQSLIDADSIILVQKTDTTFDALAVSVYKNISVQTLKQIYKDRFEKSNSLRVQSAKNALSLEEKAKRDEAKYTEVTGDTIQIDSINIDGDWGITGGEVKLKFTIANNKSESAKVKLKIISVDEIIVSVDKVGDIAFYKQEEGIWLGKADTLYKMILDKTKPKKQSK
jgi:hypothetical protein